jgi:16S rRNA (cytidine1402-2'-O)-methyltransferase
MKNKTDKKIQENKDNITPPTLYVVPTPIGNLDDITFRAVKVFQMVDVILAEDTRQSGILLKHLQIQKPLQSYHIFNEHQTIANIIRKIKDGVKIALVSDAGTPAISDPGFLLVRECLANDIQVECLPGATAFVPALVKSGLSTDRFIFEGFLPHKKGRKTRIENLANEDRTMIFYESPHRLIKALEQFMAVFGETRRASVSRELTKIHEETINASLKEIHTYFSAKVVKGEIVMIIEGKKKEHNTEETEEE